MLALRAAQRLAAPAARRAVPRAAAQPQRRALGAGGGRPWADPKSGYYGHFHVSPWYPAIFYCTVMWLWMMYRAKEDGAWVLGFVHPWDAHGDHDDHGDGHGDGHH